MKKQYIKPEIEIEEAEEEEMIMASNPGLADYYVGGENGGAHLEYDGIGVATGGDDEWDMGAKHTFAFTEDFEYSIE